MLSGLNFEKCFHFLLLVFSSKEWCSSEFGKTKGFIHAGGVTLFKTEAGKCVYLSVTLLGTLLPDKVMCQARVINYVIQGVT